jgi:3-deoxy-D-manno-octulosonic-acid transferase
MFSVFYIPTLIFKGKLHKDFLERFGIYGDAKERLLFSAKEVIWIEAVSVGEVTLCKSLIPSLKKEYPERSIVLSTITRTGNNLAKKLFSGDAIVIYFPLDFSFVARRALRKIHPKFYIMIETEIWPNVLKELGRRHVPSILINGRISDRSFGKYKLVRRFLAKTLKDITAFCMQSDVDAERIISLGAARDRVAVTGNMKFDACPIASGKSAASIKELFGMSAGDEIFVAGSTHGGEEEAVVSVYKELIKGFPNLQLVIAPRHIERASEAENIAKRLGLEAVRMTNGRSRRSSGPGLKIPPRVLIIDEIGYLNDAYSIAEIVFVGGSLIPHGGQNPIEPAVLGKAVVFGPYMFNFKTVASALLKGNGAVQVNDRKDLFIKVEQLLTDKERRAALGRNAGNIISENRGATSKSLGAIRRVINND